MKFVNVVNGALKVLSAITGYTGNANEIIATDGTGRINANLMPVGIGADITTVNAGETLAAGDFVWINSSGEAVKATNALEKPADGFVIDNVTSGQPASVYRSGHNTALTGLTAGTRYWLGTAGGVIVAGSVPTAAGTIVQSLGVANSTTSLNFDARNYILNG